MVGGAGDRLTTRRLRALSPRAAPRSDASTLVAPPRARAGRLPCDRTCVRLSCDPCSPPCSSPASPSPSPPRRQGGIDPSVAAALAPEPGGQPIIGEPSAAAEAAGVRAGMRLTEALALCPGLALLPPDPIAVEAAARAAACSGSRRIGAAVEPVAPGCALLAVGPIERLHGGLPGVLRRAAGRRAAPPLRPRLGAAPGRFPALAAARRARPARPLVLRPERRARGARAAAGDGARADAGVDPAGGAHPGDARRRAAGRARRARPAARARPLRPRGRARLAAGPRRRPDPLAPRPAGAGAAWSRSCCPSAVATEQALDHALRVLVERLLARPERRGREPRTLRLMARLVGGGSWERTTPAARARPPTATGCCWPCTAKLRLLPAPADRAGRRARRPRAGRPPAAALPRGGRRRAARGWTPRRGRCARRWATRARCASSRSTAQSRLPERRFGLVPR